MHTHTKHTQLAALDKSVLDGSARAQTVHAHDDDAACLHTHLDVRDSGARGAHVGVADDEARHRQKIIRAYGPAVR